MKELGFCEGGEASEPEHPETDPSTETVNVSVSDAESWKGSWLCYHIPQIHIDGQREKQTNELLYRELSEAANSYEGLRYTWGVRGDCLTIMVQLFGDTDFDSYRVYHISIASGQCVSEDALLAAFETDRAGFESQARAALTRYWDDFPTVFGDISYMRQNTLSDSNLQKSMAYITPWGELGLISKVYSPYGAEHYWYTIHMQTGEKLDSIQCSIHS